tara:strand:+ start:812 stop:940 length:129 start_codon:yes stop_codon:yes gene_type:complete
VPLFKNVPLFYLSGIYAPSFRQEVADGTIRYNLPNVTPEHNA